MENSAKFKLPQNKQYSQKFYGAPEASSGLSQNDEIRDF